MQSWNNQLCITDLGKGATSIAAHPGHHLHSEPAAMFKKFQQGTEQQKEILLVERTSLFDGLC